MPYYQRCGNVPPKRHTQFHDETGRLYHEEVMGQEGFSSDQSILYHVAPPTEVLSVEWLGEDVLPYESSGPLRHRLLRTASCDSGGDAISSRIPLMGNDDVRLFIARPDQPMDFFYRYAHGDEVLFIHEGTGELQTQFGVLTYQPGDYVVIPNGTIWKLIPQVSSPQRMFVVEASGHIGPPRRYLSPHGQFLEHSPYCERDLHPPAELVTHDERGEFEVRVKARGGLSKLVYANHPFDVVGWDGCLWPYTFSIHDFEPITGRVHQPPPVHQTFEGPGFVICSFVPRLYDYHPQAIPAPYHHSNTDSDEVLYYVAGSFMSRRGIEAGSISIHPNGIPHGPHPGKYEGSIGKKATRELAVMVDTFRPLRVAETAHPLEDTNYFRTWLTETDS